MIKREPERPIFKCCNYLEDYFWTKKSILNSLMQILVIYVKFNHVNMGVLTKI